jgi:hypothetical protein
MTFELPHWKKLDAFYRAELKKQKKKDAELERALRKLDTFNTKLSKTTGA